MSINVDSIVLINVLRHFEATDFIRLQPHLLATKVATTESIAPI